MLALEITVSRQPMLPQVAARSLLFHDQVADFARHPVTAVVRLVPDHDPRADAGAQVEVDQVASPFRGGLLGGLDVREAAGRVLHDDR